MTTEPLADWDEACVRLESYLQSHGVEDREHLLRLTLEILDQARELHLKNADEPPVMTTLRLAIERTDQWFSSLVLPGSSESAALNGMRGRAAWFAMQAQRRWSGAFLAVPPPVALLEAVRRESIQAGPGLEFSSLQRQEVDYGPMEDLARETLGKFSWRYTLQALVLWTLIFFIALIAQRHFFP